MYVVLAVYVDKAIIPMVNMVGITDSTGFLLLLQSPEIFFDTISVLVYAFYWPWQILCAMKGWRIF